MIPLQRLRDDPERYREGARRKRMDAPVDEILELDERARGLRTAFETSRAEQNAAGKLIKGKPTTEQMQHLSAVKDRVKDLEAELHRVEEERDRLLLEVPNPPHPSVPEGASAADSVVVREWGDPPVLAVDVGLPHWDVGERLGVFDWERAARLSGSRFAVLYGDLARLQRALATMFLDHARDRGHREVAPPLLVRRDAMVGTGQLPKFEDDAFKVDDDLFLVPTGEVPLTNLHREEILEPGSLPIKYVAWTPCFRREAGAAGRDTRGFIRLHQFEKVEMVRFVEPEHSESELAALVADAAAPLQALGLRHRILLLCDADMGFTQSKTFDIEVWAPGMDRWLEVSSCTDFGDFQARRADIRYRAAAGDRPRHVHTLNGSALALPRVIAALLETGQQPDGSVALPEAIRPYLGGQDRIAPER